MRTHDKDPSMRFRSGLAALTVAAAVARSPAATAAARRRPAFNTGTPADADADADPVGATPTPTPTSGADDADTDPDADADSDPDAESDPDTGSGADRREPRFRSRSPRPARARSSRSPRTPTAVRSPRRTAPSCAGIATFAPAAGSGPERDVHGDRRSRPARARSSSRDNHGGSVGVNVERHHDDRNDQHGQAPTIAAHRDDRSRPHATAAGFSRRAKRPFVRGARWER